MNISFPKLSLIVLIGPSGSGKSTFAREHFLPTEIVSSDFCRGLVSDDENNQTATKDAFDVLNYVAAKRLAAGLLTVVDATNVQQTSRAPLVALARKYHTLPVGIVFNLPEAVCQERNRARPDRNFGPHVIRNQRSQLRRSIHGLRREGFRHVFTFETVEEVSKAVLSREPLWNDRRNASGPFDFIGDVHGCCDELETLLTKLGYQPSAPSVTEPGWSVLNYAHPEGRTAVFVGDLVDRGPRSLDVVSLVRNMINDGHAMCVPGNHDVKLLRHLRGKQVRVTHGLAETLAEIDKVPAEDRDSFQNALAEFLDGLVSHYVLDHGKIVVAHAGLKESLQGRASGKVREFALYGDTTGERDEYGLPIRLNWAADYRGDAMVVYGHTPVPFPEWLNGTINIDTGCVFGGALTALRYPERELVSVPAEREYYKSKRPFLRERGGPSAQHQHDELLDLADISGKKIIATRLRHNVTIREENGTAALEIMSRFAANPKWLIYLPPTMSPCATSEREGYLEHPDEAFAYFRSQQVREVICQEKHMGSRSVIIVCRDEEAALERFGIEREPGIILTRTGRRFFDDRETERALLDRLRNAMSGADLWNRLDTGWALLDCELMPWSAKARELIKTQYAAVGAAATAALPRVLEVLQTTTDRLADDPALERVKELLNSTQARLHSASRFVEAYRQYCWDVDSLDDFKIAPFHLLATEEATHTDKGHHWHMQQLATVCQQDPTILIQTPFRKVDVNDPGQVEEATDWWLRHTQSGGEGMVVKPLEFIAQGGKHGLVQPAVKCRGREYLRIIYGPDYDHPDHLRRLRNRGLGAKRSLALREFALGIEALERFQRREPLRRIHECVFGVLALESEPVDPRL